MAIVGSKSERTAQGVVELVVPSVASISRFYTTLGFVVERHGGSFVSLKRGDVRLFVSEDRSAPVLPRWANLRIIVDDVDAVWTLAQDAALHVQCPIGDRPYGLRDFTLRDPAGFEVRFAKLIGGP